METLHREAQQVPAEYSQLIDRTLDELRLAVEELHVAEEEILIQNEQLIAAQQLAETERQRYQDLFEFAPDGYLVTDIRGVVREANHAAAALLNIERQYLVGKPLATCVVQPERAVFRALLDQTATCHRVQDWEIRLLRRPAKVIISSITVETVQGADGHVVGLRWQMRDISDRKKAEAVLNQLQAQNLELLEADRLRNQLLATVSHEFKTPMNAILGFSQMLIGQFHGHQDAKTTKMVERIFHNGQHLLSLMEDMLHCSQLRMDQVELQLETFDLLDLVTVTLQELRPLAEQKALTLRSELPDAVILVTNDRRRLRQILTNLWSNAIKFTDAGWVMVRVQVLPTERLLLQVKDTGRGISPQNQPHIFQEFWQVHDARTRAQGTGLGLAIVHALVKGMQGNITVESELGQGSQFEVELPQTVAPSRANPAMRS
ncbi:PAS domain-containing sensor histidine kinase [Nodosilinea nodulosa]|uniref:PAS domain-containing sensor histidine kinase n=1 Tax=Nodosilinea nodulosa TaxID=416001 RepID=UPI00031D3D3B|nr:PAS domain-containing sensor histidine kinase [Nodosilinea nodulosa]